jgi:prophage regulatory protein
LDSSRFLLEIKTWKEITMTEQSERFLRIRTVLDKTGLSRSTLYRKIDNGTFPRQFKISDRCCAWRQSAVDAWIKESAKDFGNSEAA